MAFSRGECRLKTLLDEIGMKQATLARKTGYTPRMISFFVSGDRLMSVEAMWKISGVIGCHMEDLYSELRRTFGSD
jgi:transcriptional regulator with XRE-family HTH domain